MSYVFAPLSSISIGCEVSENKVLLRDRKRHTTHGIVSLPISGVGKGRGRESTPVRPATGEGRGREGNLVRPAARGKGGGTASILVRS